VASKHGVIGLARSLAVDYGPRGIRANALCPGWVVTAIGDASADELAAERGLTREDAYALATEHVPLRRPATAEEIAACVLFLASDESSYVNGATLFADGGSTAADVGALAWEVSS
jgi:NAD(P)-dependent dehydrogenase (short-subunit alcohol dehydrogenase family)